MEALASRRCRRPGYALSDLPEPGGANPRVIISSAYFLPVQGSNSQVEQAILLMSSHLEQTLRFRRMTLEDIPRVHELDVLSFTMPWPEKSFHFELTQNPSTLAIVEELIVQEATPLVVGMAVVWIIMDEAHIATIAVHPDYRGGGLGKRLLIEALHQAIQQGATLVTLEVRENNHVAREMYTKFGFRMVGRRAHYYADNQEDAILMTIRGLGRDYDLWLKGKISDDNSRQ